MHLGISWQVPTPALLWVPAQLELTGQGGWAGRSVCLRGRVCCSVF